MITAAACHDFEHPGFNNIYMVNTKDPLALLYNDVSVLESHHIAASFKLLHSSDAVNFTKELSVADYNELRQTMIKCVLATDMVHHF